MADAPPRARGVHARRRVAPALVAASALAVELAMWGLNTSLSTGGDAPVAVVVAVAVAAYAPLALGASPLLAFWAMWVFSLAGLLLPGYEFFAGLLVCLYRIARHRPQRQAVPPLVASLVPIAINAWNAASFNGAPTPESLLTIGLLWTALFAAVWAAGRVTRGQALKAQRAERTVHAARAQARLTERTMIARELHDIVAHSISGIVLQAAGARNLATRAGDDRIADALGAIEATGGEAMRELHRLLGLMRGARDEGGVLDADLAQHRLTELDALVGRAEASGLSAAVTQTGTPRPLDPSVEHAAYRTVQESLTNALKYGGTGCRVAVELAWRPDTLVLTVRSHSGAHRPAPTASGGHGLVGLAERIDLLGGRFDAGPTPDGYVTQARLPVRPATHPEEDT